MNKPNATAVGRILKAGSRETPSGKEFAWFSIGLTPIGWQGKSFEMRIEARTFRNPQDALESLQPGDWAAVAGDVDADTYTHNGNTRAKIVITGSIFKLPVHEGSTDSDSTGSTPQKKSVQGSGERSAKPSNRKS